jgi:hypothetical protein
MRDNSYEVANGLGVGLKNEDGSEKPSWNIWANSTKKGSLSCGFENLPYTRLKRGYNPNIGHIVSSRFLPNDFNIEWNDIGLLRNEVPNSIMLYECLGYKGHTFISKSSTCEGVTPMGPVGYILNNQKTGTIPIYRCSVNNGADHIVSKAANCEGQQTEMLLGYAYTI